MASFTALVFPGQGAQQVGMGADVAARFPRAKAVFTAASRVLGYDLLEVCAHGPAAPNTAGPRGPRTPIGGRQVRADVIRSNWECVGEEIG